MIDEELIDPWPAELIEALEGWKQGDVVKEPPFLYAADLSRPLHGLALAMAGQEAADGYNPISGDLVACEAEDVAFRPPYGIITTQTCDMSERGRPAQPWFQVAPVYRSSRPADATLPRYQVRLDRPEFNGEPWVADLRIEVPVEKTALIDRTPIASFASETGYIVFGTRLGHRQARAALADELEAAVIQPLRNRLRKNAASKQVRATTYGWGEAPRASGSVPSRSSYTCSTGPFSPPRTISARPSRKTHASGTRSGGTRPGNRRSKQDSGCWRTSTSTLVEPTSPSTTNSSSST